MSGRANTSWSSDSGKDRDYDRNSIRRSNHDPAISTSSISSGPSSGSAHRHWDNAVNGASANSSRYARNHDRSLDDAQRHRNHTNGRGSHHHYQDGGSDRIREYERRPVDERRGGEDPDGRRERRGESARHDGRSEWTGDRRRDASVYEPPHKRSSESGHSERSHRDARSSPSRRTEEATVPRTPPRISSPLRKRAREGSPRGSNDHATSSSSSKSSQWREGRLVEDERDRQAHLSRHGRSLKDSEREPRDETHSRSADGRRQDRERKPRERSQERREERRVALASSPLEKRRERGTEGGIKIHGRAASPNPEKRWAGGRDGNGSDEKRRPGERGEERAAMGREEEEGQVEEEEEEEEEEEGEKRTSPTTSKEGHSVHSGGGKVTRMDVDEAARVDDSFLQQSAAGQSSKGNAISAANTAAYHNDDAKSAARSNHFASNAHLPSGAEMPPPDGSFAWQSIPWPEEEDQGRQRRIRKRNRPPQIPLRERTFYGCSSIDQYNLGVKLGQGTFGEVKKASHSLTGVEVALKMVTIHEEKDGMPITAIREIKLLKKLSHPSIVAVIDMAYRAPTERGRMGEVFMVEPYMDHDLNGMLENPAIQFTPAQIKLYMKQLFEGTLYMHQNKILHRDMKAANLLINNRGQLQIADFGLARPYHDPGRAWDTKGWRGGTTGYTSMVVTRWYRPPELLAGDRKYGPPIDMWGLGCILAEMINRKPIFKGSSEIDQLDLISRICGSPNEQSYPGWNSLPGVKNADPNGRPDQEPDVPGRHDFGHYPRILVQHFTTGHFSVRRELADLIDKLLVLNPCDRITAKEALEHEWFWQPPFPADPDSLPTYQASKEIDRQRRDQQKNQQQRAAQAAQQLQQQAMNKGGMGQSHPIPGFGPRPSNGHFGSNSSSSSSSAGGYAANFHQRPPPGGQQHRHPSAQFHGRPAPMMANHMNRRPYPPQFQGQLPQQPPPPPSRSGAYNPYDQDY